MENFNGSSFFMVIRSCILVNEITIPKASQIIIMSINEKVFEQFPILKTNRLTLRDIQLSDAEKIFEMRTNGKVNQINQPEFLY